MPRALVKYLSIPVNNAPPPHNATPRSIISEINSGGVFSVYS
jgi:hypothetical protein